MRSSGASYWLYSRRESGSKIDRRDLIDGPRTCQVYSHEGSWRSYGITMTKGAAPLENGVPILRVLYVLSVLLEMYLDKDMCVQDIAHLRNQAENQYLINRDH
jgi:hypothetical protein